MFCKDACSTTCGTRFAASTSSTMVRPSRPRLACTLGLFLTDWGTMRTASWSTGFKRAGGRVSTCDSRPSARMRVNASDAGWPYASAYTIKPLALYSLPCTGMRSGNTKVLVIDGSRCSKR